jgi:predicted nucleic acid-binding protein
VTLRALCDTNVLVSAFIAGGPPSRVIEEAIEGRLALVLADPVLAELERGFRAPAGPLPPVPVRA